MPSIGQAPFSRELCFGKGKGQPLQEQRLAFMGRWRDFSGSLGRAVHDHDTEAHEDEGDNSGNRVERAALAQKDR